MKQDIEHQFSFNWKYREFEIRTNANYNREPYVELIKWKEDGTCFTLAIYRWDKEGGEWCFIGDRPFEHIAEIDVTPIWKQMWMAAEMFTDWYEKERFDF